MPVSEDMIAAAEMGGVAAILWSAPYTEAPNTAQAVINAAWTKFDKADKKTWPVHNEVYLTWDGGNYFTLQRAVDWQYVTHYAELDLFKPTGV